MAIITFAGRIGSGKSTIAPRIARALGYESIYIGNIFRDMARERNLSIEQFYEMLAKDPELERSVDATQVALMREKDNIVIQGRVAFFFAKQSGKPSVNIYLEVAREIGAQRKIEEGVYSGKTIREVVAIQAERERVERERYLALYGIKDHLDPSLFDIGAIRQSSRPTKLSPSSLRR